MAKKKSDELTPRQRQSRAIMREKAARKRRQVWARRAQIVGAVLLATTLLGGGSWLAFSGASARTAASMQAKFYRATAQAGLKVQALYLEGRNRTPMPAIELAMAVKRGTPILSIDLEAVQARLEKIESVKAAAVERALPDTLYVRIVEREPVALWQNQGKMALVDENGAVMTGIDSAPYHGLPLIVGEGAEKHVGQLMGILAAEPDLAGRFAAAVRIGDRRWNLRLAGGVEVKLPEQNPELAWKKLAKLQAEQKLLDRAVKVIDLRLGGRLFITVNRQDSFKKAAVAKET